MTRRVSVDYLTSSIHEVLASAGILAYFIHTLTAVRIGRWPLLLVGATLFTATTALGRRLGTRNRSVAEPIVLAFITLLAFTMPVASLPGPRGPGFASAAIGVATVYVLWAALRYEVVPHESEGLVANLAWGLRWGAGFAGAFSVIAIVIVPLAARSDSPGEVLPFIIGGYWLGGIGGGVVAGLLRPLAGWPLARIVVGGLVGFCAYGAMAMAMSLSDDPQLGGMAVREQALVALIAGLAVGPPAALGSIDW